MTEQRHRTQAPARLAAEAPATLVALLERRAAQTPAGIAYTFLQDGEFDARWLSYGALHERARAIAASLTECAEPGARALIVLAPGLDYIAAFFGCLMAGLIAVPVPLPQGKRGLPRLLSIVRDCRPRVGVTSAATLQAIRAGLTDQTSAALHEVLWCSMEALEAGSAPAAMPRISASTVAFLQYTSGSTGAPKGVALTHENLLHNEQMIQAAFAHDEQTVVVGWLPPYHDMGLIGNILQPLYLGVPCVQMAPQHFLLKPVRWLSAISRFRATTSGGPNFAYELCLARVAREDREVLDLSSWRVAFNGAEPIRAGTLERFAEVFAACGFQRRAFYPCYGLAEATLLVTGALPNQSPVVRTLERDALERGQALFCEDSRRGAVPVVSSGRVQAGADVRIVDPASAEPCADGKVGEIWVAGASVARGYWERTTETARTFGARLRSGEGRYLRTGDLGFVNRGELYVTGRLKDLIIVRGRNIYPQDLEQTAEESARALRGGSGAAFSQEIAGEERVVLVLEAPRHGSPDLGGLGQAVRQAVGSAHEVALHALVFIRPGSLPRTTSGKVQRAACKARYLDGTLDVVAEWCQGELGTAEREPPRTELERTLARIWGQVLSNERVGRSDDFLSLGGDSLHAAQICARVYEACGVELNPARVFDAPTIAELAAWIEGHGGARARAQRAPEQAVRPWLSPLSHVQERLWLLEALAGGEPAYHIAAALHLRGTLDVRAIEQAVSSVVARHDALRTSFPTQDGTPMQRVHPALPVQLPVQALGELDEVVERAAALRDLLRARSREPFQLGAAPPVRWQLIRTSAREHTLSVVCHHLIADGWSFAVLLREIAEAYRAYASGEAPQLLPATPYSEFVTFQRDEADHAVREDLAYWRARLADLPDPLELPTDRSRPAVRSHKGGRVEFALSRELTQRVGALGRRHGATLFATLATGLLAFLQRHTGQTDLCIGVPVAGRPRLAFEETVGCFLNSFALRVGVNADLRISDLIRSVQEALREAQEHQRAPFERVLEALRLKREGGHSPLFQVMLSLQPTLSGVPVLPGLELAVEQLDTGSAQLDLSLDVRLEGGEARCAWEYSSDLFEAETVRRFGARLTQLLEAMTRDPALRVAELPLNEAGELLVPENAETELLSGRTCVHALFEAQAARRPWAEALVAGSERLTYADLNERSDRLARVLQRRGVGPESRVGVCLERGVELVVSVLAVLKAGGAYLALDVRQPVERLAFMLTDADAGSLITRQDVAAAGTLAAARDVVWLDRDGEQIAAESAETLAIASVPERLAYVVYTSGSTGTPKGVMVQHDALSSTLAAWRDAYAMPDGALRMLQLTNPAFDVWTADMVRALCSGGTLVLAPSELGFDAPALTALMRREAVTVMDVVPALVEPLLEHWRSEGPVESLRLMIVGSDVWSVAQHQALRQGLAPHTRLLSCYGVSEASIDSALFEGDPPAGFQERSVPLGRALANARLYVLDAAGQPLPTGIAGELAIGGHGVARGYVGRPRSTAERFVPDPFSGVAGARLYRTGDRARWLADGTLEFLGRMDRQIKLRGIRIEPSEIEARLRQHTLVRDAVVLLREEQTRQPQLAAYLVPEEGAVALAAGPSDGTERADALALAAASACVREALRAQLPEPMVPSQLSWMDALPLSPNGKVDRRALAALPLCCDDERSGPEVAPEGELERTVAQVFQEVLGLSAMSRSGNFFDLGGNSLQLMRARSLLCVRLGREIAMLELFRHPSVAGLAESLAHAGEQPAPEGNEQVAEEQRADAARARRELLLKRRREDAGSEP